MKKTVYIDGQAGTTGLEIYERLEQRADLEILKIDEAAFIITNETHNVRGRGFTLPNIDL